MTTPTPDPSRATHRPVRGRATMLDVAALAGVSLKSVSRVVNHEPGVSEVLAQRVDQAVAALGYRHNLAASNLRRGTRTKSIGMLVQDLSNEYCSATLRAVEDRARERGVAVLASSIDEDVDRERDLVTGLVARRIDGLVLMPSDPDLTWLEEEIALGLAVVGIDRRPTGPPVDAVVVDNVGAAHSAVTHLVGHGHRRIGFLGDVASIPTAPLRQQGYRDALRDERLAADPGLERVGLHSRDDARRATLDLLASDDPPTALFAARNSITLGALLALQQLGRSHEVALIGFDDLTVAELVEPRITVVRQDTYAIGHRAIDLLLARLDGDDTPSRVEVVPTTLVARGSGEIAGPGPVRGRP